MGFEIGDLVWAKMKGFPPWPAQIVKPTKDAKPPKNKKNNNFVYFYGTKDHAWIPEENIMPHNENILTTLSKKKSKAYQLAVDELLNNAKTKGAGKQTSPKIKEKVETEKKTKVVKVVQSVTKKRERNVLAHKSSPIKQGAKKRRIGKEVRADSSPKSSRRSVEKDYSFEDLPGCSSDSGHRNISGSEEFGIPGTLDFDTEDSVLEGDKKFGFIGLHEFGRVIVTKLIKSGIDITLWDKDIDRCTEFIEMNKAKLADSPAQLILDCDVTFCCYDTDTDDFKDIIFGEMGILEGFEEAEKQKQRNKGYVGLNFVEYETSNKINETITIKNGCYLEAPILSTFESAADAEMIVLASGNRKLFVSCEKCFQAIASKSFFVSCKIGFSSKMSVLLNTVSGTLFAALSEAMVLSDRLELYKDDVQQVFAQMLQGDTIGEKLLKMSKHNYEPVTPLKHVQKDMNLALHLANGVNQSMPVTSAANEVFKLARLMKHSDSDVSAIYKVVKLF